MDFYPDQPFNQLDELDRRTSAHIAAGSVKHIQSRNELQALTIEGTTIALEFNVANGTYPQMWEEIMRKLES